MEKLDFIQGYIDKAKESTGSQKELLIDEIINVFENEINDITRGLSTYDHLPKGNKNFTSDMKLLSVKLENYMCNIKLDTDKRRDELEQLKLKSSIINVNNSNNNISESHSSLTSKISIEVSINQTIDNIYNIPENVFTKSEKEELEEKISAIEVAINANDKEKVKTKIQNILKYVADKSIEVGIAVLPYLANAAIKIQ